KSVFLETQAELWKNNKNLSYAGDILGSSFVLGVSSEFEDVAKYILEHTASASNPLTKLALKVLNLDEKFSETNDEIQDAAIITKITRHELRVLKQAIISEPKNPIAWMEMGRLYALEGQTQK